jgi:hypothetical protein
LIYIYIYRESYIYAFHVNSDIIEEKCLMFSLSSWNLEVLASITLMVQNVMQGHTPLEGLLVVPSNKGSLTTAGQGNQIHPLMENI